LTTSSLFHKSELPGGLRVVTERVPGVRSVALGIWVTVGSRHETEETSGISHFIEHMAFKGTQTRSALDIARTIEQGGGYVNAFTGKELTCFFVHVLDEQLPTAVDILSDILANSVFEPEAMGREKQVILDEIRDMEDSPDEVIHELFAQAVFEPHSLARSILGPPANITRFTREDLLRFIQTHYSPDRVLVAAAGRVDHRTLTRLIREKLRLPAGEPSSDGGTPAPMVAKKKSQQRAIQQAHVCVGGRGFRYRDKRRYTLSVLNTVLGGGMSSRLFQNIREKYGIAYSIYSFADLLSDTGLIGIYFATDASRVEKALELVAKEIRALKEDALKSTELHGIKTQLKGNIMLGLEQVANRMNRVARAEIYLEKYADIAELSRKIDAVTARQIRDLTNELFREENLTTVILEPNQ
jgi:predicted Zn-dependent peptidase